MLKDFEGITVVIKTKSQVNDLITGSWNTKSPNQLINSSEIKGPTTKTDDYNDNYAKDEVVVTDEWLMFCKQQQEEMFKDETSPENQSCRLLQTDSQIY